MFIRFGEVELDVDGCEVKRDAELQAIEPKAFNLLLYLIENRTRVVSKDEIYQVIWDGRIISEATLTSCINVARTAIGDSGKLQKFIRTFPRRGYRFIGDVALDTCDAEPLAIRSARTTAFARSVLDGDQVKSGDTQSTHPSIVVVPFDTLGSGPEQELLADGIAADITTELSRLRRLFVVSRNTASAYKGRSCDARVIANELGVQYVLEGSIQQIGNKVRVAAQLIDGLTSSNIWAERYDRDLDNLFALEDEITEAIVAVIEPEILTHERVRLGQRATENMGAWQLLQKGLWHYYHQTHSGHEAATQLFRQAVKISPKFASARAHLAFSLWTAATQGRVNQVDNALIEAKQEAQLALSLDPDEPLARFVAGRLCLIDGQVDLAIQHMQAGIDASPSYAGCHYGLGMAYYHGKAMAEDALAHFDMAARLNPRNPMIWATHEKQGCANRFLGRLEDALMFGWKARSFSNEGYRPHLYLAAALAAAGQGQDAWLEIERAKFWQPEFSISFVRDKFTNLHQDVQDDLVHWLRTAGLD